MTWYFVLQGVLNDGYMVAIKKILYPDRYDWTWNYDMHLLVSKLQHKNIVRLVGYGHEVLSTSMVQFFKRKKDPPTEREFIWVEEYVPNGSLHFIIQGMFPLRY